jgi:molybdenum-dependent DNA-binding transcriptional regulator ModE
MQIPADPRKEATAADPLRGPRAAFLAALLSEPSIERAAKKAGVSARSGFVYLKEPAFSLAYRAAKTEAVSQATALLQSAAGEAVETLREVMQDQEALPASRVAAARTVLELAYKAHELETVTGRLDELEATLAELRGKQ